MMKRLLTFPILVLQIWPQYRMIRVIYFGLWRKDPKWRREQKVLVENVISVEPFVESTPQVFWLLFLWGKTGCVGPREMSTGTLETHWSYQGITTTITSVISASYGLSNYLSVGPLNIMPRVSSSRFCHLSFWLTFISVGTGLIAKGASIASTNAGPAKEFQPEYFGIVILLTFIPQLMLSFITLLASVGFKKIFRLIIRHPALVIMPVFTPFTFGPHKFNICCTPPVKVGLHYVLTFVNMVMTITGMLICLALERTNVQVLTGSLMVYGISALSAIFLILSDLSSTCCFCLPLSAQKPDRKTRKISSLIDA